MSQSLIRLLAVMTRLRAPDGGCPWDLEQTFATIAPHTIEEAYEVADAIERGNLDELRDELGDLLFQVVYHSQIASEQGAFGFEQVAAAITDKMIRRHPHVFGDEVFGDESVAGADAQTARWEEHKARERARAAAQAGRKESAIDGVARGLPALTRALKLQRRAARVGFDWIDPADILDKIEEEVREARDELAAGDRTRLTDELGDLLFCLVNLARRLEVDPEAALRHANAKFEQRFVAMEALAAEAGQAFAELDLDRQEALWQLAKQRLANEQAVSLK